MKQHGGEGKEHYKGTKSDTSLPIHGGEGKGMSKGGGSKLSKSDCGPGKSLGSY